MIDITNTAINALKMRLEKHNVPNTCIRIGVKGSGGCNGFMYDIAFENKPARKNDTTLELDGLIVLIDSKSLAILNGTTIDYERTLMVEGFKFINPNEKSKCGCGKSFST